MTQPAPFAPCPVPLKPNQANRIFALGILSLALVPGIGTPFGIIAWVLANRDLRDIDAGLMDPSGRQLIRAGRTCGMISVAFASLVLLIVLIVLGVYALRA